MTLVFLLVVSIYLFHLIWTIVSLIPHTHSLLKRLVVPSQGAILYLVQILCVETLRYWIIKYWDGGMWLQTDLILSPPKHSDVNGLKRASKG